MKLWNYIDTMEALEDVSQVLLSKKIMAVDTETTGLNPYLSKLRLIQIAVSHYPVIIIDCFKIFPYGKDLISKILSTDAVKIFQNAKFDIQFLKAAEILVSGKLFDTMLAGQLLRSSGGVSRVGLKSLVEHYLGEELSKEEQRSDFSGELNESQLLYAAKDAQILLELREEMISHLKRNQLIEVARIEFECVYAIAEIEYRGIHISLAKWQLLTTTVEKEMLAAHEKLYPFIGYPTIQYGLFETVEKSSVNLNSHKQVLNMLRKHGLDIKNSSKNALSNYRDHPIVKHLLDYRHANKALTSFLYSMPKMINPISGRLHPRYGQNGAYSGRMSCGGPNIQQIPRENRFRSCFEAPYGRKLVIADYSQIELRVIAQFTMDRRMIKAYKNHEDLHKLTASLMLEKAMADITKDERQAAKAVNFGLVFGMGAEGLKAYAAETYGSTMSLEEAKLFKERFFTAYSGIDQWHKAIKKSLPREARTLAGRKFLFRKDSGMSGRYNTPIQGTAADILKNALGNLYYELKDKDTFVVAVVHDEIVLECPEEEAEEMSNLLRRVMEKAGDRYLKDVPTIAEAVIADTWAGK